MFHSYLKRIYRGLIAKNLNFIPSCNNLQLWKLRLNNCEMQVVWPIKLLRVNDVEGVNSFGQYLCYLATQT